MRTGARAIPAGPDWWRPVEGPAAVARPGREGALAFGALMAFTAVLILSPQSFLPALVPLRIAFLTAGLAIAAHVLGRLLRGRPVTIVRREILLAAALAGWAIATAPLSVWPGGTMAFIAGLYLKAIAVFWLLANVVDTAGRFRAATRVFVLISVPLGLTAAHHFATGFLMEGGNFGDLKRIEGYEGGLTGNPNDLALMLNLILPFAVARACLANRGAARVAYIAIAVLDAVAVVLTFSRAGFLTLLATIAAYLLALGSSRLRLRAAILVVVLLFAVPFLPSSYLRHMGTIADIDKDPTGSAQTRWNDMLSAARLVYARPVFGAGAGMDILAMNEARGATWTEVHNAYLEFAVDLGLPGLLLFLALLGSCLATARAAARAVGPPGEEAEVRHGALAARVSLTAFAISGAFNPVGYQFYFYYVAGLAVALATITSGEAHER